MNGVMAAVHDERWALDLAQQVNVAHIVNGVSRGLMEHRVLAVEEDLSRLIDLIDWPIWVLGKA